MKVEQFYNKNQFLIVEEKQNNNIYYLQSYNSIVARIDARGVLAFGEDWDYSKTTSKHLYLFLADYKNEICAEQYKEIFSKGFDYSTNKKQFLQKLIDKKIIKIKEL